MPPALTSGPDLVAQILTLMGGDPGAPVPEALFRRASRKQLLDCAQRLGLNGVSKLVKDELAQRVQSTFDALRPSHPPAATPAPGATSDAPSENAPFPPKFDLGPDAEVEPMPDNIPWGYGDDRVTAMAVDPDRLYVYWEVTDEAVQAARSGLGHAGASAWLNLRVYDISGRLFDGTNAHAYFDHRLERHDRQWFFGINKPSSSACVEIGLRSDEGYFVKIARSGRVDFARREPAPGGPLEWLSVRAGGNVIHAPESSSPEGAPTTAATASSGAPSGDPGPSGSPAGGGTAPGAAPAGWEDWTEIAGFPTPGAPRTFGRRWSWQESAGAEWAGEAARVEWAGPVLRTEWQAGPFTYPIEVPSTVEIRDLGEMSTRTENGRVHVMYGPWQVIIRGLGARAERRVLGTWEYRRQVAIAGGSERTASAAGKLAPGSSEWMTAGASERVWLGASELLARGGSELWMLGASEVRLGGASETLFAGASERLLRGASELSFAGASERLLRGASERTFAGASERLHAGSSERLTAGGSERSFAGASERSQPAPAGETPEDALPSLYPAPDRPGR
jgi:hypothetical protein